MAKPSKAEKRNFRRTATQILPSNLPKRVQPRGGKRR